MSSAHPPRRRMRARDERAARKQGFASRARSRGGILADAAALTADIHSLSPPGKNEEVHMSTAATQLEDVYARDARLDEVFAADGYAKTNADGDIERDKDEVVDRITAILIGEAIAESQDDRLARALSRDLLYPKVFPHGPALDDPDDLEREVAHVAAVYAWTLTQPSHQGR